MGWCCEECAKKHGLEFEGGYSVRGLCSVGNHEVKEIIKWIEIKPKPKRKMLF